MIPEIISNVLGGVLNANAQESANYQNYRIARDTNAMQYKMFQEQMDYQTAERLATQEYNSPENQRRLYEQAGINPYAVLGNINPNTVAQTAPSAPNQHVPEIKPNEALGNMMNDIARSVGVGLTNEQIGLDNETKRVELAFKTQEKILDIQNKIAEIESKKVHTGVDREQIRTLQKNLDIYEEQLDILRSTKPEVKKQAQLETKSKELENRAKQLSNEYSEWQNEFAKKRGSKELGLLDAQIKQSLSQSALNGALSASAMADKALRDAETAGVKLDNDEKKRLRGHVLKMARLAEQEVELKNELTKYQTGVNGRDWLNATTSILNGIGTALTCSTG